MASARYRKLSKIDKTSLIPPLLERGSENPSVQLVSIKEAMDYAHEILTTCEIPLPEVKREHVDVSRFKVEEQPEGKYVGKTGIWRDTISLMFMITTPHLNLRHKLLIVCPNRERDALTIKAVYGDDKGPAEESGLYYDGKLLLLCRKFDIREAIESVFKSFEVAMK